MPKAGSADVGALRLRLRLVIRPRNDVGLPLAFWLEYLAPARRADCPFNRCAGARRLKQFALVALLGAIRRVLVPGILLRHLVLRCRGLRTQGKEDHCAQGSGRRAFAKTAP